MRTRLLFLIFGFLFVFLFAQVQLGSTDVAQVPTKPPVELKGSDESQRWQNHMADLDHLNRIQNQAELLQLEKKHLLVPLPETSTICIDPRLKRDAMYCYTRPWTRKFLKDMALAFVQQFPGSSFQVNSAVRDRVRQRNLQKQGNHNAAAVSGPKASSHLTGATIDIAKHEMSKAELAWWRKALLCLERQGLIEATEESNQAVFHIMVFKRYAAEEPLVKVPSKRHKKNR